MVGGGVLNVVRKSRSKRVLTEILDETPPNNKTKHVLFFAYDLCHYNLDQICL